MRLGDQELAVESIFTAVARERATKGAMRTVIEHRPKKQRQSNGVVRCVVGGGYDEGAAECI